MTDPENIILGIKPLPIREYRTEDARLDAAIEDWTLREAGVIEPDQPTAYSDYMYRKKWNEQAFGEFTPEERAVIRANIGLGPFA
jgi:hypothetical protein